MEPQKILNSRRNFEKEKKKAGGTMLPNLNLSYKAIIIKIAWFGHRNSQIDQQNLAGSPEINSKLIQSINP